ncbi:MAG: glycosyl hydrolase family 8 [bacterium]|nr:glycosyl hydrolase family 8 [bacterium]
MSSRIGELVQSKKFEIGALALVLIIAALAHGINMFNFPYYENDEGVYMSQAWSLVTQGKLAPYTYWYDHAPFGWMLIAVWTLLTGGFYTFGFSLNSGRVLMLVIHLISSVLLYLITKKLTGSRIAALSSILFFSLTPLGIYFQRRVLLDNIMIMWAMVSLYFILHYKNRLTFMIYSAITLALAVLTKENAIFFIPLFLYLVFTTSHKKHRNFAVTQWLLIVFSLISLYFVYSFIKGEFFPAYTALGGNVEHVSLLETLRYQSSRSGGSILDLKNSLFWQYVRQWAEEDWIIMYVGMAATIFNLILALWNKNARITSLFAASMFVFMMRGGIVIEFYIIPLIPLLALNIAYSLNAIAHVISGILKRQHLYYGVYAASTITICFVMFTLSAQVKTNLNLYTSNQTKPQRDAVEWIKKYRSPEENIIIDNYAYLDLRRDPEKMFNNADWYWKVDTDKDVFEKKLASDPDNIDYIAATPQMEFDIKQSGLAIVGKILAESRPVTQFYQDGWGVTIWGNQSSTRILTATWESYKKRFIKNGQVIDPSSDIVTSEGQAYALLRAVWLDDRNAFESVHAWTQQNLKRENNLLEWRHSSSNTGLNDPGSATDADQDYALALLFAYKRWGNSSYLDEAKAVINSVWNLETATLESKTYSIAGEWARTESELILNPSYLSPTHYRIFAVVDPNHNWQSVIDTSYEVLNGCTIARLDKIKGVLPPEWCALRLSDRTFTTPSQAGLTTEYGYNAFRIPWRIALDYEWNRDASASEYLRSLSFLSSEWTKNHKIAPVYSHDGVVIESYESAAAYAGNLGYYKIVDPDFARSVYQEKILSKFYENENESYWDDPNNYYTQNLSWFGTALYTNKLPNLWK